MMNLKILTFSILMTSSIYSNSILTSNDNEENDRLCNVFQKKAKDYKMVMRNDEYAAATLKNYNNKIKKYCKIQIKK